ncbi:hypothetical protein [Ideonella sp. BN130291]|uniref:hypothetical protein n=1 Tax=Ideonella sp. BN130291 TaxID=3112940 RepID=UPI002E26C344|nr:hypothetical protein [Ideonella sp. BN130291]
MELTSSEDAFLSALVVAKESWLRYAVEAVANPSSAKWSDAHAAWVSLSECAQREDDRAAFRAIVNHLLSGLVHSMLVTLDGGSVLSETTTLTIQDAEGVTLKSFLHEYWPDYSD